MPVIFDPLWKTLIDKKMKKTELGDVAGLSSRTLSKLSKNKTVSTETLSRICEALHCDLCDVAEYSEPKSPASFWEAFCREASQKSENALIRTYTLSYGGEDYIIYETRRRATKNTTIECKNNGTAYWVQFHKSVPGRGKSEKAKLEMPLYRPEIPVEKRSILLIRGRPGAVKGLDEGIFVSPKNAKKDGVAVMSEAGMKCFVPSDER